MITLQHTLSTLCSTNDNSEFKKVLPYALLPDAIRMYTGERQYSHFEKSSDGKDVSYMEYPEDISNLTKELVNCDKETDQYHLSDNIKPCVIGEDTDINAFYEHNAHLPENYHRGVELHLKQDICFDKFIREQIDCSDKYNDNFVFNDKHYDGKGVRGLIADIEQWGVYVLAHAAYEQNGIVANQDWFDSNVKPLLDKTYPKEMADNTYKYMKINPDINELITNKDWSYLDKMPLPQETYDTLYKTVNQEANQTQNVLLDEQQTKDAKLDTSLCNDACEREDDCKTL